MSEQERRSARVRTFLGAQIVFNNRNSTFQCQIRNISETGAKLEVSDTVSLPNEFELQIPKQGKTYQVRLRWRALDSIGVEFLDINGQPVQARGSSERLADLERENALLHARIEELTRKLEQLAPNNAA